MSTIKNLDSTAIYAYTTLISVLICVPAALIAEGSRLPAGIDAALAKDPNFYFSLFMVGLLYHLYNQVRRPWTLLGLLALVKDPNFSFSLFMVGLLYSKVRQPRTASIDPSCQGPACCITRAARHARAASRPPADLRGPPRPHKGAAAPPLTPRARAPVCVQHAVAREPGLARRVQRGQACGHHRHLGRLLRHHAHQQDLAGCAPHPRRAARQCAPP